MKKRYNPAFSLLSRLAIALMMLSSHQLTAQTIPTKKTIPGIQKIDWREGANRKNVTFSQVQAAFKSDWTGKKPKKGEGYKVFKRWENYMAPRVYPSGNMALPSTTYANYMAWQKQTASQQQKGRVAASTANFTELNPNAKASGYDSGVGRIDYVRFDPSNPNIMYVCSPDGGLWKSTNGGTTWTTNTDFLPVIGCADLVIDPTNTQTMYLATGNRERDRFSIGILKSTNGGATWNPTGLSFPISERYILRRLIMDPTNPQIMMAVGDAGVFRTTDGWATSTRIESIDSANLEDAEFKPGDPNTVYAIGTEFYKSTNKGVSWTKITSGLPAGNATSRALIAVTAANPNYVYAVYGNTDGGYLGTFRSTNSGTSFTQRSSPTSPAGTNNILNCDITTTSSSAQAGHNLAIVASPTNAEVVTIGGCNVLQSTNGGTTWTLSSYWLGLDAANPGGEGPADYVHADIQSLDYLPGSNTTLFVTCDGGISKSTNNGTNWTDISNNLRVAQMTNVGQSSLTPYNMITGLQDIGTLKNTNGAWSVTNGGDGEDGFIDRTNDNNIITSNPNGAFALSNDGGVNRSNITGLPEGTEFFSPIHQDPVNAATVYAGGRARLYRSTSVLTNPDAAWTALGTPPGEGGIQRFEIAPSNNRVIYVLKGGNTISKSTNGGTSFANITGTLPVGDAQVTNLCVSNTDANKVWVTFSGYEGAAKVYKSVNGGATWTNISAGLPNIPMNTIVYLNNSASDAVYVGADIGVYYFDNTTAWTSFFTGLPNNHVNDLEIYYPTGKIRAATYGRGLWESNLFERSLPVIGLTAPDSVASEHGGSGGGRLAAFTKRVTPSKLVRKSRNARSAAEESHPDPAIFHFARDNADESLTFDYEITGSATDDGFLVFDSQETFAVGEFEFDLYVYPGDDLLTEGDETLTFTILDDAHYDVHHTDDAATITILGDEVVTAPFNITGVTTLSCTPVNNRINLSFNPQYAGMSGQAITFQVVNELPPTTNPGPYTLQLYADNPVLNLKATQSGTAGEVSFSYNWVAACNGMVPGNTAPTVANVIPSQSATLNQPFNYGIPVGTFTDAQTPNALVLSVSGLPPGLSFTAPATISGTPSTSVGSPFTVNVTATDPGSLSVSTSFTITVSPAGTTPNPTGTFALTGVSTVGCTPVGNRINLTFNPQYGGGNGQPITFSVVNELAPTTQVGPYSLALYADNPVLILKATQSGTAGESSFSYNWVAACNGGGTFGITAVTMVSCQTLSAGQRQLSFTPQYSGLNGQAITFSVANELSPTTTAGPYTLRLYTDNPVITLKASQLGTAGEASFPYNWVGACNGGSGRIGAEPVAPLQVRVLGNPAQNGQVSVEVLGAAGQPLWLTLTTLSGQSVDSHQVDQAEAVERHRFKIDRQSAGQLLLRVTTPSQSQTVKVIKPD